MTPAMRGAEDWETRFPRTLEERIATFVPVEAYRWFVEAYGWFVIGALLLIGGVFGVATMVIALREARRRKGLEALDALQVHDEVRTCAEPETQRTGSERSTC